MRFGIHTLDDYNLKGKRVICRVDLNQPVDHETGKLKSISRIKACVPTLTELSDKGARVILLAHQGSDIEYQNYYTTKPHRDVLEDLLKRPVKFIEDVCGPAALEEITKLQDGEILLLDNVRYVAEEQTLFERSLKLTHEQQAKTLLVRKLAPLGDLYLCDAFAAAHRDQPSLCGFEQVLPSAMGRLFEEEYCVISELMESPEKPATFVLGGAKVADAFMMMNTVLSSGVADNILAGGLVGQILLAAKGLPIGEGSLEFITKSGYAEFIESVKPLLEKYSDKIHAPIDLAYVDGDTRVDADLADLPKDASAMDIGKKTADGYARIINESKTVFVNGPMGVFEKEITEYGTKTVWEALASTSAHTVVGGGDSLTATTKYNVSDKIGYLCTGGGALIRFLTGEELPDVQALRFAANKFPL